MSELETDSAYIRTLRESAGFLTYRVAARFFGINETTWRHWEQITTENFIKPDIEKSLIEQAGAATSMTGQIIQRINKAQIGEGEEIILKRYQKEGLLIQTETSPEPVGTHVYNRAIGLALSLLLAKGQKVRIAWGDFEKEHPAGKLTYIPLAVFSPGADENVKII